MSDALHTSTSLTERMTLNWMKAQPIVASFLRGAVRDHHHCEDLLQQVAITVVQRYHEYREGTSFINWVLTIARYHVLNYRRVKGRDRHVFDDDVLTAMAESHERVGDEIDDRKRALESCIQKLPARGRRVIDLRYQNEMSVDLIAKRLNVTSSTVFVLLHRVRKALARCVEDQMHAERMA